MLSRRKQYMDGNGRMGRFLMNVMMAAGGISLDGHTRHFQLTDLMTSRFLM